HGVQVGRKRVVIVSDSWLARSSETAAIVRDHPMPGGEQCRGLLFPRRAVERPAVNQNDRRPRAMVLVVELDVRRVLLPDADPIAAHGGAPRIGARLLRGYRRGRRYRGGDRRSAGAEKVTTLGAILCGAFSQH